MSKWVRENIGELCCAGGGKVQTGPFGSQLHQSDYSDEGTPVVMPADITAGGGISERRIVRVSERHVDRLARHKLSVGDIVYGRRGDIGRQSLVRESNAGWLCGTGCLRLTLGGSKVIPEFLHLYLKMPSVIGWIQNQAVGATMPNLNTKILERIPVSFPKSKSEQQKIVNAIFSYDELIEVNNRRIALLEKMAEEIYREWFVRMRFPGHQQAKFNKGIPQGWELKPFCDVVEIKPTESIDKNEEHPYVGMEDLSVSSMLFMHKEFRTGNSGAKFRNGDTLFPRITPCLENGKRGYVMCLENGQVGFGSTEFIVLREAELSAEHIYLLSNSSDFRKHAELSMTGASGRQRVQEDCFEFFLVKTPPQEIAAEFSKIVRPIFSEIKVLYDEVKVLERTRDRLLPRLISGKLSVEELEIEFPPGMEE